MDRPPRDAALRVMLVLGTRGEAVRLMPVLAALRTRPGIHPMVLASGEHRPLLDQALAAFGEKPDIDLGGMRHGEDLTELLAHLLLGIGREVARHRPDLVLVAGDSTTTLAGALAAFHARVPIGHVEAGQRSFDLDQPFPEEANRVTVDNLAELMFATNEGAAANLRHEYNRRARIHVTGSPAIDALLATARRVAQEPAPPGALPPLDAGKRLVLVTAHRRESLGACMVHVCEAVEALAARGDVEIVWPMHCTPAARRPLQARLAGRPGIHLVEPLGYAEMVRLMGCASLLMTDSGTLQEEALALGLPVLLLRAVTERPEGLASGGVRLVGTRAAAVVQAASRLLDDPRAHAEMSRPRLPFGDGRAAGRIADAIAEWAADRSGHAAAHGAGLGRRSAA